LRLTVPYALVAALAANVFMPTAGYRLALLGQMMGYSLGVLGLLAGRRGRWNRLLTLPSTFLMLNAAAVAGAFSYISGRRQDLWRPASAQADATKLNTETMRVAAPATSSSQHVA